MYVQILHSWIPTIYCNDWRRRRFHSIDLYNFYRINGESRLWHLRDIDEEKDFEYFQLSTTSLGYFEILKYLGNFQNSVMNKRSKKRFRSASNTLCPFKISTSNNRIPLLAQNSSTITKEIKAQKSPLILQSFTLSIISHKSQFDGKRLLLLREARYMQKRFPVVLKFKFFHTNSSNTNSTMEERIRTCTSSRDRR